MTDQPTLQPPPDRPFAGLKSIYFGNLEKRQFFRQNTPTGGIYLECWVKGNDFAHILSTVEHGTPARLEEWMRMRQMEPITREDYESHFFQLCRELEAKRRLKNDERQRMYDQVTGHPV